MCFYLKQIGADGFLIGRAFMEADNPGSWHEDGKEM